MATKTSLLGLTKPAYTEAADIAVLNTNFDLIDKAVGRGARAENLLDNSDFRKGRRIAQAGENGLHGTVKYVCDRWISWDSDAIFADGYITPGSPIDQRLNPPIIDIYATYTAAICLADGTIRVSSGTFAGGFGSYALGIYCPAATTQPYVRLNYGINIRWAALYEGAYTEETLPAYVYKGYAAELMECMRHYQQLDYNLLGNGYTASTAGWAVLQVDTKVPMRVLPTAHIDGAVTARVNGADYALTWSSISPGMPSNTTYLELLFTNNSGLPPFYSAAFHATGKVSLSADL